MTILDEAEQAFANGEINEYFFQQAQTQSIILEDYAFEGWLDDAKEASKLGVSSAQTQKVFFNIGMYAREIIDSFELLERTPRRDELELIIAEVYSNHERYPIDTWLNFAFAITKAVFDLSQKGAFAPELPIRTRALNQFTQMQDQVQDQNNVMSPTLAYPQGIMGAPTTNPYDISRWMKATRDIYAKAKVSAGGLDEAFKNITENWNKMEKLDYKHFLRFYQENAHNKYKIANGYEGEEDVGYVLPQFPHALRSKLPSPVRPPDGMMETNKTNDSRDKIEIQRFRIISRLNSAEKLLASMDGQIFAGEEQEFMLKLLQDLKRKVQIANKITLRSSLFEDYIYRTANMLNESGRKDAATFFYKIAVPPSELEEATDLLGGPGGISPVEDTPGPAPSPSPQPFGGMGGEPTGNKDTTKEVFKEFYARLETGVGDIRDEKKTAQAQAQAIPTPGGIPGGASSGPASEEVLPKASAPTPKPEIPKPVVKPSDDLEVSEKEEDGDLEVSEKDDQFDNAIEEALHNITIEDVISHLELLSGIFRKREVARQISVVDMMMDSLGISSYFPGLGEAARSALESNQYVSTRIDDILAKLRGSLENEKGDELLEGEEVKEPTELQSALEDAEEKDKERKERRKKKDEAKELGGKPGEPTMEKPEVTPEGVGETAPEELAAPARVERAPARMPR